MENKDYRETIGKRLEEALKEQDFEDLEDLIEMPSIDTFNKWVEEADQRREKKFRTRKIMSMCAVFAVVIAMVALAIAIKGFAVPDVEADPEQERSIDNSMETTATYTAWSELPEDIKEQFIEFTAFPDGYEVDSVVIEDYAELTKVIIEAKNETGFIRVRQILHKDGTIDSNVVAIDGIKETWNNIDVRIKVYDGNVKETTYTLSANNVLVDIIVNNESEKEEIKELITKAVR